MNQTTAHSTPVLKGLTSALKRGPFPSDYENGQDYLEAVREDAAFCSNCSDCGHPLCECDCYSEDGR